LTKGSMLLFPSFLLHKVCPVTWGIRKTLTTWVLGPKLR
jgi:PKHD-type hydroxylase